MSAYGTKYDALLDTIDGQWTYDLRIQEDGFVGSSTEFQVVSWHLSYDAEDVEGGFMPSTLTVQLRDTAKTLLTDFFGDDERHVRAELYQYAPGDDENADLIWTGYLKTDEMVQPLGTFDNTVTLIFSDGLEDLDGIDYPTTTGRTEATVIVGEGLSDLGLLTGFQIAADWRPYASTPITGDPLLLVRMDRGQFLDDGIAVSIKQAVEVDVAKRFQLKVLQANGKWRLLDPELLSAASYTAYNYVMAGTADGTEVVSQVVQSEAAGIGITSGHVKRGRLPFKKAKVTYEHGPKSGFQGDVRTATVNGDFESDWTRDGGGNDVPSGWTRGSGNTFKINPGVNSLYALGFNRNSSNYTSGDPSSFASDYVYQDLGNVADDRDLAIRLKAKAWYRFDPSKLSLATQEQNRRQRPIFWDIRVANKYSWETGATYYWYKHSTNTWISQGASTPIKNRLDVGSSWLPLGRTSEGIKLEDLPATKQVRVYLWQGTDTVALSDGSFGIEKFVWDDVFVDFLTKADEIVTAIESSLVNDDIAGSEILEGSTFRFGDGPGNGYDRRLTILESAADSNTGDWKKGTYEALEAASGTNLDRLWLERKLKRRRKALIVLECTIRLRSTAEYWPHQAFQYDGVQYECISYSHNLRPREIRFTGVQVLPDASVNFTEGFIAVTSDVDGDVNAVTIQQSDTVNTQSLGQGLIAVTAETLSGTLSSVRVESLPEGIAKDLKLLIVNPNGGYDEIVTSKAVGVGESRIEFYEHIFDRAVSHPAGVYLTQSALYSLVLQTQNAVSTILKGHAICEIDGAQRGNLSSLTVTPLKRDLPAGEALLVRRDDGSAIYEVQVGAAGANEGDLSIPLEGTPWVDTKDGDDIQEALVQFGAKLVVKPDEIQQSVERQRTGSNWTTLSAAVSGAAVTSLSVEALPSAAKSGDKYEVIHKRTGDTVLVTLSANAAAAATSVSITAADFSGASTAFPIGSRVRLSDETTRAQIIVNADNILLRVEKDDVINQINISTEGILISGSRIEISGSTTFTTGYNPSLRADVQHATVAPTTRADGSALRTGDLWVETDNLNKVWTRTAAAAWAAIDGVTATGVNVTIRSATAPTTRADATTLVAGDLWIETDDGDKPYSWSGSAWVQAYTNINGGNITTGTIAAARITLGSASTFDAGYNPTTKTTTFRQDAAPTALATGDIWIDTNDGNRPYTWSGSAWVAALTIIDGGNITTGTIAAARITLGSASTFDAGYNPTTKATTFRQTTAPTALATGDIWIDTDDGDRVYTWSGSAWTESLTVIDGGNISASSQITAGTGNNVGVLSGSDATYRIWAGHATAASATFRVTQGGVLTATGATITGSVTSTSGAIGGWTLGATTLTGGNATLSSSGVLTLGTGTDVAIMSAADGVYRFWVGHTTPTSAPLRIGKAGNLIATSAQIVGNITAESGSLVDLDIDGTLTMGVSGVITNSAGDFTLDQNGLFIATSSTFSSDRSITLGSIGEIYALDPTGTSTDKVVIQSAAHIALQTGVGFSVDILADSVTVSPSGGGGGTVWHSGNDGASSGLDADLLDGSEGSAYAKKASAQTITGAWTFDKEILLTSIAAPGTTSNRVYNEGGAIKWAGSRIMLGPLLTTELLKINTGIASNAATNMPQYTKTITVEDAAANTIKLYGT